MIRTSRLAHNWALGFLILFAGSASLPAVDLLYLSVNNSIVTYDTTGNDGATIAGTVATFANTNLSSPQGLAFDSSGNLYAANASDNTISKFNSSGGYISSISGLSGPEGLAIDSTGNLYAANFDNDTISKFDSTGGYVSSNSSTLDIPFGLAMDSTGNLYAANLGDNTISKYNSSGVYLSSTNST